MKTIGAACIASVTRWWHIHEADQNQTADSVCLVCLQVVENSASVIEVIDKQGQRHKIHSRCICWREQDDMERKTIAICITREPITGFCYPFSRTLLNKLISLAKENKLFTSSPAEDTAVLRTQSNVIHVKNDVPHTRSSSTLTPIAEAVVRNLCSQLKLSIITETSPQQIGAFIDMVREFLDMFEKE